MGPEHPQRWVFAALVAALLAAQPAGADVAATVHNLAPSGPGDLKNPDPVGLCRFCHTPHGAGQTTALWNRGLPTQVYTLYESSTLEATLEQPTGSSRLCLSCHDGTVALGSLLRPGPSAVAPLGHVEGLARIDTDLSDDHPVSFVFDEGLAARNGELVSPTTLTGPVTLDATGQMQCTACHDPHDDRFPDFLVMDDSESQLCVTCHLKRGWTESSHATSNATWSGQGEDPWPESELETVRENGCRSCHDSHAAALPERLLREPVADDVCFTCHDGEVAQTDLRAELQKSSVHPIETTGGVHDPAENPVSMDRHVSCSDCHNPHAVSPAPGQAPLLPGVQQHVRGLDLGGVAREEAEFAYEVCLRCHGVTEAPSPRVVRFDHVTNVRLEIEPGNASYHPVAAVGANPLVTTLIPPLTTSSLIYCHDCHNSDDDLPAGLAPGGPHGSQHEPLLAGAYPLIDLVPESSGTYELCYACHDRQLLFQPGGFDHAGHVQTANASCAACHDAHGSRVNPHLINFLRFDALGNEVVAPSLSGRLEFEQTGPDGGRCFLSCHAVEHDPREY